MSLRQETIEDAIGISIKSDLLGLPGLCLLQEYKTKSPKDLQRVTRRALPMVFQEIFLQEGVVRRSGNYFYLWIDGDYTGAGSRILQLTESYPKGNNIFQPPSPSGSHVTLRRDISPKEVGARYEFELDVESGVISFPHDKAGKEPSGFDPTLYPVMWYIIKVKGLPPHLVNPPNHWDPPHISIAVQGFRKGVK